MNLPAQTKEQIVSLLKGIELGRTLHDLEKQAGASVEALLSLLQSDEDIALAFRSARQYSTYVIEDEISRKLADNVAAPESAVKNNALKIWADHMHKVMEARNPATYSGKAAVNMTVPIKIVSSIDLGDSKTVDGIYELKAEIVEEVNFADLPPDSTVAIPAVGAYEPTNDPISRALVAEAVAEVVTAAQTDAEESETEPGQARWDRGMDAIEFAQAAGEQEAAERALEGKQPAVKSQRRGAKQAGHAKIKGKAAR